MKIERFVCGVVLAISSKMGHNGRNNTRDKTLSLLKYKSTNNYDEVPLIRNISRSKLFKFLNQYFQTILFMVHSYEKLGYKCLTTDNYIRTTNKRTF